MRASHPTLSVVFPNYNDARFLPVQLESMLSQSYPPMEIIIIDDASTDNSVEVINRFIAREPRIRLICNERNIGVERNINRLVAEAKGDYLYLSAADDAVMPGFFEQTMAMLAQYPQAALCTGLGRLMNEAGRDTGLRALPVISRKPCFLPPDQVRNKLSIYGRWFAVSSMIVRRDLLLAEGGQVVAAGSFADTLNAMVLALRHGSCFIPVEFSRWRQKAGANSKVADWEAFRQQGAVVSELMRTRYSDLFPPKYIERFERHWWYGVMTIAAEVTETASTRVTAEVFHRVTPVPSLVDRMTFAILRLMTRGRSLFWRAYAFTRFGPWQWWLLGRLSIVRNYGSFVLREDQRP